MIRGLEKLSAHLGSGPWTRAQSVKWMLAAGGFNQAITMLQDVMARKEFKRRTDAGTIERLLKEMGGTVPTDPSMREIYR